MVVISRIQFLTGFAGMLRYCVLEDALLLLRNLQKNVTQLATLEIQNPRIIVLRPGLHRSLSAFWPCGLVLSIANPHFVVAERQMILSQ